MTTLTTRYDQYNCWASEMLVDPPQAPPVRWTLHTLIFCILVLLCFHVIMLSYVIKSSCYHIIILRCYDVMILWWYNVMMFWCYDVILLWFYHVIMLSFYHIIILSCYHLYRLPCYNDFSLSSYYVLNIVFYQVFLRARPWHSKTVQIGKQCRIYVHSILYALQI